MDRSGYNQLDRIEQKLDILLQVAGVKIQEEENEDKNDTKN